MNIEDFPFSDAATVESGKLNILGPFDPIWGSTLPAVHPQCAIALRMRFDTIEKGEHKIVVNFVDADGKNVIPPAQGVITLTFSDEQRSGSANMILNLQGVKFEKF